VKDLYCIYGSSGGPIKIGEGRGMSAIKNVTRKRAKGYGRKTAKEAVPDAKHLAWYERLKWEPKPPPVTLDDVWAGFAELQNVHKETEKGLQELRDAQQKAQEKTEKDWQELRRTVKKTSRIVGDLGNRFGENAEYTLVPGLPEKFRQLKLDFDSMSRNKKINDKKHNIHAEVDAYLENGGQTMGVEVKSKLQKADVDNHIKRMEKLRAYADLHGDKRDLYGALAAIIVNDEEREYALENGFFVIEPSGEDVKVTEPASSPRIWQASDK
jgi:hypothetical protein